jgi:hypothetical protein
MSQRQAIGIDDPIAARDRLKSPGSGKAALRHQASISCAGADGPSGGYGRRSSRKVLEGQGGFEGGPAFTGAACASWPFPESPGFLNGPHRFDMN